MNDSTQAHPYTMIKAKSTSIPFDLDFINKINTTYETPFYIYDEREIKQNAKKLNELFSWNVGFKEYFAVKALPNPHILSILRKVGFGADCSSLAELITAKKAGLSKEQIMFTSNDTPDIEFIEAAKLGSIINLDDIEHLHYIEKLFRNHSIKFPDLISFRFNPGKERRGNIIIGNPEEAKFGCTKEQLFAAYKAASKIGVSRFGIHAMLASNELDYSYFIETVDSLIKLASEISNELNISFEFINMGGGLGIPYKPEEKAIDLNLISSGIKDVFDKYHNCISNRKYTPPMRLYMECGRFITGPYGYLVSKVIHKKKTYKNYLGLDACMANLMRPGMYGAYHHISVLGKENNEPCCMYDVVGSLCENNDKFAIDRILPEVEVGDLVVIHDVGAHGHAMGFNYNGKLRSAELLLREDSSVVCIRRAETLDDYFSTIAELEID